MLRAILKSGFAKVDLNSAEPTPFDNKGIV